MKKTNNNQTKQTWTELAPEYRNELRKRIYEYERKLQERN